MNFDLPGNDRVDDWSNDSQPMKLHPQHKRFTWITSNRVFIEKRQKTTVRSVTGPNLTYWSSNEVIDTRNKLENMTKTAILNEVVSILILKWY